MDWAVAVTTAPRSPATLTETLLSLRDAGWPSVTVFADSEMQLGPFLNLRRAVAELMERNPAAVLVCQDDIQVTKGLRDWLDREQFQRLLSRPPLSLYSLYTAGPNHNDFIARVFRESDHEGWHPMTELPQLAHGALAYVFSCAVAERFLAWKYPTKKAPADWLVGCFCRDNEIGYLTHSPSFIRHTGEVSSLPDRIGIEDCGQVREARQCKVFLEAI